MRAEIQSLLREAGVETQPALAEAGLEERIGFSLLAGSTIPTESQTLAASPASQADGNASEDADLKVKTELEAKDYLDEPEGDEDATVREDDRPVSSQPYDWTISTLRDKFERGKLDLQPHYQRQYVWKLRPELPSRLIESLLLEIPIPPIYFGKLSEGRWEVIDGQQRLTTLINYVTNKFALVRLQRMSSLNQKYFRDLSEEQQAKISDAPIRSIVIDAGTNDELRYEVFERLNRGSMALNEQELRNCVYRGPFNDLLGELERDPEWRRVKRGESPDPRFIEREMILRFFAFANRIDFYAGNLKRFLSEYMKSYAPRDPEQITFHADTFRLTMQNIYAVFGENSARLYTLDDKKAGHWDPKFSIAALDIQASALVGQSAAKVQAASEQIRESYLFYMLTDPLIQSAISKQTGSTASTKVRWSGFKSSFVQAILAGTNVEPRFFSYEFRRELFEKAPVCKLCGNEIHRLEDSTVDHITPWSKKGTTKPENAQLAHRSCNAIKCANTGLPT